MRPIEERRGPIITVIVSRETIKARSIYDERPLRGAFPFSESLENAVHGHLLCCWLAVAAFRLSNKAKTTTQEVLIFTHGL